MSEVDRTRCRQNARDCIELAHIAKDPQVKAILLTQAQEWIRLAYAANDAVFRQLVADFNANGLIPSGGVQRQPVQQQQRRTVNPNPLDKKC